MLIRAMKKIISTSEAPAAVGPYSQAIRIGNNQPPVRSTVHVSALPKGATIEIEVIAVADPIRGKAIDTWE
jgi:enamine deaminase RidA (YjgF/YER057c/UK114 family)